MEESKRIVRKALESLVCIFEGYEEEATKEDCGIDFACHNAKIEVWVETYGSAVLRKSLTKITGENNGK